MDLALFDFDGTITSKDSFLPFVKRSTSKARFGAAALFLIPYIIAYKMRILRPSRMRAMIAKFSYFGRDYEAVSKLGCEYAFDILKFNIREEAISALRWHQKRGDAVVIVSAALDVYMNEVARLLDSDLICTRLEYRDGRLTGCYVDGDCTGPEKARRILKRFELSRYGKIFAYGDTIEDTEMIKLADIKIFRGRRIDDVNEIDNTHWWVNESNK